MKPSRFMVLQIDTDNRDALTREEINSYGPFDELQASIEIDRLANFNIRELKQEGIEYTVFKYGNNKVVKTIYGSVHFVMSPIERL